MKVALLGSGARQKKFAPADIPEAEKSHTKAKRKDNILLPVPVRRKTRFRFMKQTFFCIFYNLFERLVTSHS